MGVTLRSERINKVLANANETSKSEGERLADDEALSFIKSGIEFLRVEDVPKTYLAVTAVLLTARALHEADELNVLAIQAGSSDRGYSASSIGSRVSSFAKEQGIDLRAKSSQPMNNQPFTFEPWITEDMKVQAKASVAFRMFFKIAEAINGMSSATAKEALALLFHLCRRADVAAVTVKVKKGDKDTLVRVAAAVAAFTDEHSENGRVGQAFVASVQDLLYGAETVLQGDAQDPDRSTPGDVHTADAGEVWLFSEVKQKVISTGDITGFTKKVKGAGGSRVEYFALKNASYSGNISPETVNKEAAKLGVDVRIHQSPTQVLERYLPIVAGSHVAVASKLLERYRARLVEAGCTSATIDAFDAMARKYADLG